MLQDWFSLREKEKEGGGGGGGEGEEEMSRIAPSALYRQRLTSPPVNEVSPGRHEHAWEKRGAYVHRKS